MKETSIISGIFPDEVSEALYEALLAIYPESRNKGSIDIRLPKEDPRIAQGLKVLNEWGFSPRDRHRTAEPNEFTLMIRRLYDKEDYENADYLVPKPQECLGSATSRSANGLLKLEDEDLKMNEDIGYSTWAWIVVSTQIKERIEQSGLKRIILRPTEIVGPRRKRFVGHFWELTSDLRLPSLNSHCQLTTNNGLPFAGDYDQGCHYFETPYDQPEFYYNANDIAAIKPFDLALTQERFGIREWVAEPSLIASKQFYEFCVENKLKMNWMPVRIE